MFQCVNGICCHYFLYIYLFIYLWLHRVFTAASRLSLVAGSEGYSSLLRLLTTVASLVPEHRFKDMRASVFVACGPSSCGSQALEHRLNSRDMGLVALRPVGSSRIRNQIYVPCIGRWILYH